MILIVNNVVNSVNYRKNTRHNKPVADLGGGMGGMHPPHQPKSNDFGRKISLCFE